MDFETVANSEIEGHQRHGGDSAAVPGTLPIHLRNHQVIPLAPRAALLRIKGGWCELLFRSDGLGFHSDADLG